MPGLLVNIDVPDLQQGLDFYTSALDLRIGRRFAGGGVVELLGTDAPIYLLEKASGTSIGPTGTDTRRYDRHWSPVHLDFAVDDLDAAIARATRAGAIQEGTTSEAPYGRLALFADPFGHGFCLVEFNRRGYDAIAEVTPRRS
ncbi:MAG: VOC family protein [Variovorax sp.]|jgi:predicted enzyme related to lactoylglutathione lyase|nr:MAG: VOC family protein [Variovorax sp.]